MTGGSAPVIEVRGVRKIYDAAGDPIVALDDVSFAVPEGSFVSLVGPSGCGKSTLLQIIAGLVTATSGDVLVDGAPVRAPQPQKIAVVFQDATLLPWKSVAENVAFPLEIARISADERRRRTAAMLELVGLSDFAGRHPHELSGGMRQRVAIARGLAQDPRIILMDEPFGALDEQTRLKMGHELLRIWSQTGKTILLITHSLTEALFLGDTVLVMARRPGRIIETIASGLPRPRTYDLIGTPEFGAARNRIWHLIGVDDAVTGEAGEW
jgi:NitT/TauT family transport system ATP-binding protein